MKIRSLSTGVLIAALMTVIPLTNVWAAHRSEAEQAIAAAKAAHEQAASVQAASPETAEMIEQAEGLLPSRQYTKAIGIADKARAQDSFAYKQASSGKGVDTAASNEAEQAISAAEASREKAASVGGEWRDTAKLIADAEGLAKSGEYAKAIKLANKAKRQGELGYEQTIGQKGAGFPPYVTAKQ